MQFCGSIAALVLIPELLFGQPGAGTLTVTSSQSSSLAPDQVLFDVAVGSGIDRGLDEIVAALAGTGISAGDLRGLTLQSVPETQAAELQWNFQLIAALTNMKSTTASLASLRGNFARRNAGLTLSFTVAGTQTSGQQSQTCDFGSLMADARSRAQNIAGAGGFTSGVVVALSGSATQGTPDCQMTATFGLPVSRSGPNTIMITASRTVNPTPDQVLIGINVTSDAGSGLDDVNAALSGAGIVGANLTGVYSGTDYSRIGLPRPELRWSFSLTTSLAKLPSTLAQLVRAQQAVIAQNAGWSLSFDIQGLQASKQPVAACSEAGLISDARLQVRTIANAAGVSVGGILSMSDQAAPAVGGFSVYSGFPAVDFIFSVAPPVSCSLSVQFQLL